MRKLLASALLAGCMLGYALPSSAYTFTVTPIVGVPPNWASPGVQSDTAKFNSQLAPLAPQTLTPPPGSPGSGFSLFNILDTPLTAPPVTDTYTAKATSFFLTLSVDGSATKTFRVNGVIDGTLTFIPPGGSNAFFTASTITDIADGSSSAFGTSPDLRPSIIFPNIVFSNGFVGTLFIDQQQRLTPPGGNPASIGGFFGAAAVPEPGTLTLLLASGVGASVVVVRRRRPSA